MTLPTSRLIGGCALVTGAQQGIGMATARALAQAGADVAINWFDDEHAAQALVADIVASGRKAITVHGDVAVARDARRMIDEAADQLGPITTLVNNAGVFPRSEFLELDETQWDHVLGVNLKGTFLMAQAAARHMVSEQVQGAIVNVSSSAMRGHPLGVHYAASKTGVVGLTRAAALALAPYKIRVNAVAPGLTDTAQPRVEFGETELCEAGAQIPLGQIAQPEDIADVVVFLASGAARFVTGAVLHANGGSYLA
ncbi:MAG: SDR family oxidoreductase [Pseudomonadota bacterium]